MAYRRSFQSTINSMYKDYRERKIEEIIQQVDEYNRSIKNNIVLIYNILKDTSFTSFKPDEYYSSLYIHTPINEYEPLMEPSEKSIKKKVGFIKENKLLEKIDKKRINKRIESQKRFQIEYDKELAEYKKAEKENKKKYNEYVNDIKKDDEKHNNKVDVRKKNYFNDDEDEIKSIFKTMTDKLQPTVDSIKYIGFNYNNRTAKLDLEFINPETEFSDIKEAKFIKSKWEIKEIHYTKTELEKIYEQLVFNTMLSQAVKVWFYLRDRIDEFIVNGYVNKINPANGKNEKFYFVSVKLNGNDIPFDRIYLLDSKMFLESKNIKYKTPLIDIKKVAIYDLNDKQMINVIDDEIDGFDFENLTKELLEKNNFENITVTQASGDYGADVIAYKDGIKYAIQCKKYSSKVGVKAVQEIIAAKSMYKCHVGVVLTNNYFTTSALNLAESNGILLWDKNKLVELLDNAGMSNDIEDDEEEKDNIEDILDIKE